MDRGPQAHLGQDPILAPVSPEASGIPGLPSRAHGETKRSRPRVEGAIRTTNRIAVAEPVLPPEQTDPFPEQPTDVGIDEHPPGDALLHETSLLEPMQFLVDLRVGDPAGLGDPVAGQRTMRVREHREYSDASFAATQRDQPGIDPHTTFKAAVGINTSLLGRHTAPRLAESRLPEEVRSAYRRLALGPARGRRTPIVPRSQK